MQDKLQGIENTPAVTERRACPRLRPASLVYIDIGNVNGGIITSLSENGLAFTAAATLRNAEMGDGPLQMRIQFPGIPDAMEASGEIVWMSSSGKEARVRFVELEDKARDQIKSWISDQTSINGLRQEPRRLPKMQLPTSPGARARRSRLSFSDVASSRVGAEGETEVQDLPEIAREPGELSPFQAQGLTFADAAEVVASAFESPAFTEDQTGKTHSPRSEPTTHTTSEEKLQRQLSPSTPERRQHSRRQILLFTYAVLGEDNGGLVFNLGESGLALTAAAALQEHHFAKLRVRFPDSEDWFETSGRLVWKNGSGKEAGIEFVGLPEDTRARIKEWVSQEEPTTDLRSGEDEARTTQGPTLNLPSIQDLPSFMELEGSSAEPFDYPAAFEEQPFEDRAFEEHRFEKRSKTPASSSSALLKPGTKGIFERASVRKRVAKIKPPRLPDHPLKPKSRVAREALAMAAGVALAVGGWMFLQRNNLNEASGIIAQKVPNTQPSPEPKQKSEIVKTEVGSTGATVDPPVQSSETAAAQSGIAKPSVRQIESGPPAPNIANTAAVSRAAGSERAQEKKFRSEEALARTPVASSPLRGSGRQQALLARGEETKAPITTSAPPPSKGKELVGNKTVETKSIETKPAENKPVATPQVLPTTNSNKDANATSSTLNASSPQPAAAPPVDLEKEKLLVVSKPPEPPVVPRTPVVNVSFDPFPSIRMPKAEKSKKSHQGKSLQMGRLLSRVDPVYPEEARQQGVEGTVRVHATFNREGAVQSVISLGGPPMLVPAAMNAVRQWRYSQTILGGQAMETEEEVTVQFRLANSSSKKTEN